MSLLTLRPLVFAIFRMSDNSPVFNFSANSSMAAVFSWVGMETSPPPFLQDGADTKLRSHRHRRLSVEVKYLCRAFHLTPLYKTRGHRKRVVAMNVISSASRHAIACSGLDTIGAPCCLRRLDKEITVARMPSRPQRCVRYQHYAAPNTVSDMVERDR